MGEIIVLMCCSAVGTVGMLDGRQSSRPGSCAITVEAIVLSVPEPGMAVVGAGKRELPHDAGMPVLLSATELHGMPRELASGVVARLFDHHAVLAGTRRLRVGDVVELGVSHPCSVFSRWDSSIITRDGEHIGVGRAEFRRAS